MKPALKAVILEHYILRPRLLEASISTFQCIQSKRIGVRDGWGTQVSSRQVVEGFFRRGVLQKDKAHITYTWKQNGSVLIQERHKAEVSFRFESGWWFFGKLGPILEGKLIRGKEEIRIKQIVEAQMTTHIEAQLYIDGLAKKVGKLVFSGGQGDYFFRATGEFKIV